MKPRALTNSIARLDLDNLFELRHTSEVYDDSADDDHGGGAFDQLVLPPGHKKMVISLISQHVRNKGRVDKNEQMDIIRGKGEPGRYETRKITTRAKQ